MLRAPGLEIQWLTDPERVDLAHRVQSYVDRLIDELAPRRPSPAQRRRAQVGPPIGHADR